MRSIRTYLLLSLLAVMTLVTFISLLQGYQSSIEKAQKLFDSRLDSAARLIANANQDTIPRQAGVFELSSDVFFQIWSPKKQLLAHSNNAPDTLLLDLDESETYNDVNFSGYRWRSYLLHDDKLDRWIVVGEREDIRYNLAETVVVSSIVPIVLAIPIVALIIWFAIGIGLKPLRTLSQQLNDKQADDLTPLVLPNTPDELTQLVATSNALLSRLNEAFLREQRFSADAAHELRTPISALKVQVHNLKQSSDIETNAIKALSDGVERMSHIIEQILALYRHSPDQPLLTMTQLDLCTVSQGVIAKMYDQIASKQQNISIEAEQAGYINGNQFALETLLENLIINANKYSPDQSDICLSISQLNHEVTITIEDSGPGIEPQDYDRVFERFYRSKGDQHDSGIIGCGLGLSIVKHIVMIHHASISLAKSEQLGGLKVMITFPQMVTL